MYCDNYAYTSTTTCIPAEATDTTTVYIVAVEPISEPALPSEGKERSDREESEQAIPDINDREPISDIRSAFRQRPLQLASTFG